MLSSIKVRLLLVVTALLLLGVGYAQLPADKTEAAITGMTYESFSYNTVNGLATWQFRIRMDDTFDQTYNITTLGPSGSIATAVSGGSCTTVLPSAAPVSCRITFPPGGNFMVLTVTSPFPQLCTSQIVAIGPVAGLNTSQINLGGTPFNSPASTTSFVAGVAVNNVVPANLALCITPTPTPVATATPVPVVVPVIPQVFQQPVGGIFNGPRSNTPTPVRPREVGTAGSTGVGLDPGAIMLRPPSTGDAGILTLRRLNISAW